MKIGINISPPSGGQPAPIMPPGDVIGSGHDFMVDDPRYFCPDPFFPRNWGKKETQDGYVIPAAFQFVASEAQDMTLEWSRLWRDCLGLYAPQSWKTAPPDFSGNTDWSWLNGFVPATQLDLWYLHLIKSDRFSTNNTGPDAADFYDPLTGFGTGAKPYKKNLVGCGGNYHWRSAGNRVWCLDGLKPAPIAEQLRDLFFLLGICTQSVGRQLDPTSRAAMPNGIFEIRGFPQAGENIVVHPLISVWPKGATMDWNGLHLRENEVPANRVVPWPFPPELSWPFIPAKLMVINP